MTLPPDTQIRLAQQADLPHLVVLEGVLHTRPEPDYAARLSQSMAGGGRALVLAFRAGVPAGYAVVNWHSAYAPFQRLGLPELQDLNVLPGERGAGLGAGLVAACEELACARGACGLGLAVGLDRAYGAAQRLYVRMGYMPDGHGLTYDREPVRPGELRPVDDNFCLMLVKFFTAG